MNQTETKIQKTLEFFLSIHESDAVYNMLTDEEYSADDIIEYIKWCRERYCNNLDTDFDFWLEDRKPRVKIEFFVTSCGHPIHEALEFPKRGEDMENGTEYEWYYSLREVTDDILKLKVGESMNFKLRDDDTSHGTIVRIS